MRCTATQQRANADDALDELTTLLREHPQVLLGARLTGTGIDKEESESGLFVVP